MQSSKSTPRRIDDAALPVEKSLAVAAVGTAVDCAVITAVMAEIDAAVAALPASPARFLSISSNASERQRDPENKDDTRTEQGFPVGMRAEKQHSEKHV